MKIKKLLCIATAITVVALPPVFAKGGSFGGGSHVSVPARASTSVRMSPSTSHSTSTGSNRSASSRSFSTSTGSNRGNFSSTARYSPSTTPSMVNHYYGYGSGYGGYFGGFWSGMWYGSLWHPWNMYYPVGGTYGTIAAPIGYSIAYCIVDGIIVILFIFVGYKIYKKIR